SRQTIRSALRRSDRVCDHADIRSHGDVPEELAAQVLRGGTVAELSVEIAGLRTEILTEDPEVVGVVRERYEGFVSPGTASWRIEMKTEAVPDPRPGGDVLLRRNGDGAQFAVRRGDFSGVLDIRRRSGMVTLCEAHEASIDSFLRIVYSLALVEVGGLVVHAASLVRHGRAYLFCGPSGSGKTTVARLSPDATLLSDELSIVRTTGGPAVCFGTPFRGELALAGADRAARLVGIYFLRHGDRHAVLALRPRQALARLLPNVLFFAREADLTAAGFRIGTGLVDP